MSRYNLLDEKWISVLTDDKGNFEEVSLKDIFLNAHEYIGLAGDTQTQDFSILRLLLSVMHTVFSRVDANGDPYEYFELDDKFRQTEKIHEEDLDNYKKDLLKTWMNIWKAKEFPNIIQEYLELWRDRFYFFDDKYPFYQVKSENMSEKYISKKNPSEMLGKNINRKISQSNNKISLFSPKYDAKSNKEELTYPEMVRWIINFQNYTGLSDKVMFGKEKYKASKGWLFDLGGVFLRGNNLFETLMLNFYILNEEGSNLQNIQKPCWELSSEEMIEKFTNSNSIDNISSLYTAWSRAISIDEDIVEEDSFKCNIVKLINIDHQDAFIEPMTIWRYNSNGENKDKHTPRKHQKDKSMWRSFGLIIGLDEENNTGLNRKPGIIEWYQDLSSKIDINDPVICSISMEDDGNATSWVPVDEIIDEIVIDRLIFSDISDNGWLVRINEVVNKTKQMIEFHYKSFLKDIFLIRNLTNQSQIDNKVEELYFLIDGSFRKWLSSLSIDDDPDKKILMWNKELKNILQTQAKDILQNASSRDYKGVENNNKIINVATAYNSFIIRLNKNLKVEEVK